MPSSDDIIKRINLLQDNKSSSGLTPQLMAAYASSSMSNDEMIQTAELQRQTAVNSDKGIVQANGKQMPGSQQNSYGIFFHDPVLQKQPTVALAIKEYLSGTLGADSVAERSVTALQNHLSDSGYGNGSDGKPLPRTGYMTQEWSAAARQWQKDLVQKQLGGDKSGSFSFGDTLSSLGKWLSPVGAADAGLGFLKSLPGAGRSLLALVGGTLGGAAIGAVEGLNSDSLAGFQKSYREGEFQGIADVNSALGKKQDATDAAGSYGINYDKAVEHGGDQGFIQSDGTDWRKFGGHAVQDISTSLLVADGIGLAAKGASLGYGLAGRIAVPSSALEFGTRAAAEEGGGLVANTAAETAQSPFRQAAQRALDLTDKTSPAYHGPGVIANTAGKYIARAGAGAAVGGAIGGATDGWSGAEKGAFVGAGLGLAGVPAIAKFGQAIDAIPALGKVGPWVDSLATEGGLYYKARRLLAIPYNIKVVQQLGQGAQDLSVAGAKAGVLGAVEGDQTEQGRQIMSEHTVAGWNDAIKQAAGPLSQLADLNNIAWLAHGSLNGKLGEAAGAAATSSSKIGSGVNNLMTIANNSLGAAGWGAHFERGSGVAAKDWIEAFGGGVSGRARYIRYVNESVAGHSAWWGAEKQLAEERLAAEGVTGLQTATHDEMLTQEMKDINERVLGLNHDDIKTLQGYSSAIRHDPAAMKAAQDGLLAQRGGMEYELRAARDVTNSRAVARVRGEEWQPGNVVNAGRYMDASDILNQNVIPHVPPPLTEAQATGLDPTGRVHKDFKNPPSVGENVGIQHTGQYDQPELKSYANSLEQEWNDNIKMETDRATAIRRATTGNGSEAMGPDGMPMHEGEAARIDAHFPKPDPNWQLDWETRARELVTTIGGDASHMAQTGPDLMDIVRKHADLLPTAIHLSVTAKPSIQQAFDRLDSMGFRPVVGTDIGHLHAGTNALTDIGNDLTLRRRVLEGLGVGVRRIDPADRAAVSTQKLLMRIYDDVDAGRMHLNIGVTPELLVHQLTADNWLPHNLPLKGYASQLFTGRTPQYFDEVTNKPELVALAKTAYDASDQLTEHDALIWAKREQIRQATAPMQRRDISVSDLRDSFLSGRKNESAFPESQAETAAQQGVRGTRAESQIPLLDEQSVQALHQSILKSYADVPMSMVGFTHIEDLFRASMGIAGNGIHGNKLAGRLVAGAVVGGAAGAIANRDALWQGDLSDVTKGAIAGGLTLAVSPKIGGGIAGHAFKDMDWAVANLPNQLVKLRNDFRFDLSPEFALRRWAKTNLKLALSGVPPVLKPRQWLIDHGNLDEAQARLAVVNPEYDTRLQQFDRAGDESARYLQNQDVLHLYNNKDTQAYAVQRWHDQGLSDDAIHDQVVKAFDYGGKNLAGQVQRGRTALEQSMNFVFFPYSFDKTLYSMLGSHLIDHAAQRMVLQSSLAQYHQFSLQHPDMPGASDWIDKHLPLLKEVERLNAFSHGVGLGQPGGINAPLLQAFLPQSWSPGDHSAAATLRTFVPALKDLSRILQAQTPGAPGALQQQASVINNTVFGSKPAETTYAQVQDAFRMQKNLESTFGQAIMYNKANRNDQLKFPLNPAWFEAHGIDPHWAGFTVTKQVIDDIVAETFPAYSADRGAQVAIANHGDWRRYMNEYQQTQPLQSDVDERTQFAKATDLLKTRINDAPFTKPGDATYMSPQQLAHATQGLRDYAIKYATTDPKFYALYNKLFARTLGPLEQVN